MFGGAVPDAITALVRTTRLAARRRRRGRGRRPEVGRGLRPGLLRGAAARRLRAPGRRADHRQRLAAVAASGPSPSITTIGIDAPSVATSSNTLVPVARPPRSPCASPPTRTRARRSGCWSEHLRAHAPWGVEVDVHLDDEGAGFSADAQGPVYDAARAAFADAWGVPPVDIGVGGSIPFVAAFAETVPRRRDPRHRRRGPRHAGARRQREPAPRRVRAGLRGRGGAAGAARARCRADPQGPAGSPSVRRTGGSVGPVGPWPGQSLLVSPGRASIWSSATRAQRATSGSTVIWLTTRPCTSDSSDQTRCGRSIRFIVEQ